MREHNLARENPGLYVTYLEELREFFNGRLLELPGEIGLRTEEGVRAVDEAISFLRRSQPIGPVRTSRGMSTGARDHVRDSGPRGRMEHVGTDGSNPWDCVNRYGSWLTTIGENIAFGTYGPGDARDVVMQLIIDDGVRSRGYRDNLFKAEFQVIGVSCGDHEAFGSMCVIVYAGGYNENREQGAGATPHPSVGCGRACSLLPAPYSLLPITQTSKTPRSIAGSG